MKKNHAFNYVFVAIAIILSHIMCAVVAYNYCDMIALNIRDSARLLQSTSSGIFLALNSFLFGLNTGMIFMQTVDEIVEIAIKLYLSLVGVLNIAECSREMLAHYPKKNAKVTFL